MAPGPASATSGYNEQFLGNINDVAIFNYALSSSQVQTLYQAGVALPEAGLTLTNLAGSNAELNWNYGTLQSAANVYGPYTDLTNATQPFLVPETNVQLFFRVREELKFYLNRFQPGTAKDSVKMRPGTRYFIKMSCHPT